MKSLLKPYLVCLSITVMILNYGCKKTDTLDTDMGLTRVKVYDDTLASIQNISVHIASGAGRMYMTYGVGKSTQTEANSGGFFEVYGSYAKLNAINNEGELLWQKTLPKEIIINDLLVLDDGSCIALGINMSNSWSIHLFHFDVNGVVVRTDSLWFQSASLYSYSRSHLKLLRAQNGNLLIYGFGFDNFYNFDAVIAAEFNMNFSGVWEKTYLNPSGQNEFTSCVLTTDGGYLFAITNFETTASNLTIFKTNATGDSLWSKNFITKENPICNSIVPLSNGNYSLSFTSSTNNGQGAGGITETYIYQVNASGDSINSIRIDNGEQRYNTAQIGLNNGSVFAIMNSFKYEDRIGGVSNWNQSGSSSVILNSTLTGYSGSFLQRETNNYFVDVCKTSDGRVACAGLVQSVGQAYYKPCLLIYQY